MKFTDAVTVSGARKTEDGYLIAEARCVRTGIQVYTGDEVGKPEMKSVRVYRGPEEVFADASLQSFTHAPITMDHPTESVTADNWKNLAVGEVSTMAKKDGDWIHLPLILKDAKGIKAIEDGKRELSAGYTCELEWTAGLTADGKSFDAIQKNIRINHLAVVDAARAGSKARIGDSAGIKWGASPFTTAEKEIHMDLRTVLVDGLSVSTTDAGAQAIDKLQKDLLSSAAKLKDMENTNVSLFADMEKKHAEALAAKDAALAAKDKELATKDAALDAEKAKVLSDAALDKRVTERGDLINAAKSIAKDVKTEGLSDAAIRKAAVIATLGDAAIKDKTEAYIDARFEILVEDAAKGTGNNNVDQFRDIRASGLNNLNDVEKNRLATEAAERDAWKTKAA